MSFNKVQAERLDFLLKEFKEDSVHYRDLEVGDDYEEKRMALRSLMNIRGPRPMREDVVNIQDEFLAEETKEKGIISLEPVSNKHLPPHETLMNSVFRSLV